MVERRKRKPLLFSAKKTHLMQVAPPNRGQAEEEEGKKGWKTGGKTVSTLLALLLLLPAFQLIFRRPFFPPSRKRPFHLHL